MTKRNDEITDAHYVALFAAIARGGKDAERAVAEVYDALARRLRGFLLSRGFSDEEARDIVQESLLNLCRAGPKLRDVEAPRAYLYRIVRNSASDFLRKKLKTTDAEQSMDSSELDELSEANLGGRNDEFDGLDHCLQAAFSKFEAEHPDRAYAIHLAVLENLDGRQIAISINRTYRATLQFLSQSRARLHNVISSMCGEYFPGNS